LPYRILVVISRDGILLVLVFILIIIILPILILILVLLVLEFNLLSPFSLHSRLRLAAVF
jgi:hypothetical protein